MQLHVGLNFVPTILMVSISVFLTKNNCVKLYTSAMASPYASELRYCLRQYALRSAYARIAHTALWRVSISKLKRGNTARASGILWLILQIPE